MGEPLPWLLKTDLSGPAPPQEDPRFTRSRTVEAELVTLKSATSNKRFRLELLDGSMIVIARERVEKQPKGLVWFGHIEGEPGSNVILSLAGDALAGSIRSFHHATHRIDPVDDVHQWLRELDPRHSVPEAAPQRTSVGHGIVFSHTRFCTDPASEVDVMVLYTPNALRDLGLTGYFDMTPLEMEARVYGYIAEANESFLDSDVVVRLRLVHLAEIDAVATGPPSLAPEDPEVLESGVVENDVVALQDNAAVQDLRNTYGADIVVLLTEAADDAGCTTFPDCAAAPDCPDDAYCVVVRHQAEDQMTFVHEVGHVFNADHQCGAPNTSSTGHNHGFDITAPMPDDDFKRHTLMSIMNPGERLPYWSNPSFVHPLYPDILLGSEGPGCAANDHSTLNSNTHFVANYRCSSPGRDDVWMKDTWSDTGDEPDPATVGEDLWNSPYIWVRRSKDPDRLHQHEHENPVAGRSNWIYVKLHNGAFTAQSGTLQLFSAESSSGIRWAGDWSPLASTAVTIPASSSTIVELPWDPVPAASDSFCVLARWESATDPMTVPETWDVASNVRNNNNLIWKNLNIVELIRLPFTVVAQFWMNAIDDLHPGSPLGPGPDPELEELLQISLGIRPPPKGLLESFVRVGRVRVRFDDVLMSAWQEAGATGRGFRREDDGFLLTDPHGSSFDFALPRGARGRVELSFERLPTTPTRDYMLAVEQRSGGRSIGGVTYDIRCATRPTEPLPRDPDPPASAAPGQ